MAIHNTFVLSFTDTNLHYLLRCLFLSVSILAAEPRLGLLCISLNKETISIYYKEIVWYHSTVGMFHAMRLNALIYRITRRQVCPLMIFLPCTQHYPII